MIKEDMFLRLFLLVTTTIVVVVVPVESYHVECDPTRTRKLLLNRLEINRLREKITQKGATVVPLKLYWARGRVKLEIGVAKGKKGHDKRQDIKERDWKMDKARALKEGNR